MEQKKITFDSFIRSVMAVIIVVGIVMLLNRLSSVLLPFFLAWLISYILFPLVKFFQYRCRLKFRILGIFCAFLTVGIVFKVCKKLLKNNGKVVMIHRPERLEEIMKSMTDNNITLKIIKFIYPKEGQNSNMIIIEGRKNARKGIKVLPPLIVHSKDNEYRDEIKKMFGGDRNESKEL